MSAFKQSMRKLGVRAGLLAGASAAVLAIAGIGASSAAAITCPNALTIQGKGSSLQKNAQEIWKSEYNTACGNSPMVEYTSTGSGPGLEAFRFTGEGSINHEYQFIASDDAPNATQITHAEAVSGGAKPIIVPVTQTAIAVVVHPPAGCTFASGQGITWAELPKVFGGQGITNWQEFENTEGTCNKPITRVVRAEGSGTTYQFKNYLQTLITEGRASNKGFTCTVEGQTTWGGLREVGTGEKPNIVWPQCTGSTEVMTAAGGGAVAETVKNTEGAIGYAALPDVKGKSATPVNLQNGTASGVPTFAEPGNSGTSNARCENSRYVVPATEGRRKTGMGEAVNWSTVFGAVPNIGGTEYPLCTLTYVIGWNDYTQAGYGTSATEWGEDVSAYVNYLISPTGQSAISGKWYAALPVGSGVVGSENNVKDAAELAAENITKTGTLGQWPSWTSSATYTAGTTIRWKTLCYKAKVSNTGVEPPAATQWESVTC